MKPTDKLGAETRYRRGVAFYTDREDVIDVHPHHVITDLLPRKERIWCVLKEKNHIQLYTDDREPLKIPTHVIYKLGKIINEIFNMISVQYRFNTD